MEELFESEDQKTESLDRVEASASEEESEGKEVEEELFKKADAIVIRRSVTPDQGSEKKMKKNKSRVELEEVELNEKQDTL